MKLFSDGTKHNLKWNTKAGDFSRKVVCATGLKLLRTGRKLLNWSGERCSWCGANCGMSSTISRKGLRCSSLHRDCTKYPEA